MKSVLGVCFFCTTTASKRTFSEVQESEDGAESDSNSYDGDDSSVSDDVLDSSSSSSQDSDTSHSSADSLLQSSGSADMLTYDLYEDTPPATAALAAVIRYVGIAANSETRFLAC